MRPYDYIIWDWNGTLLDDLWLALEVANGMLRRRGLSEMDPNGYREIFDFPVETYYRAAGFDFSREPFPVLADEFIGEFNARVTECELHQGAREVLSAVQRDRLLVYHLLPIWNYRSWRRHFSNKPECCSAASVSEALRPLPIYIDHGCRKPRDYVKRTGNASWFLGEGG